MINYNEISRRTVYNGKRVKVEEVRYKNGNMEIYREHVIPGDSVVILPITDDGYIIMIKEPRTAIDNIVFGLPAGQLEKDEEPEIGAKRELQEETGYIAGNIEVMRSFYPSCGYSSEKITIFLATNLKMGKRHLDDTEDIEVVKIKLESAKKMLDEGKISTASSTIALFHYFCYVKN